MTHPVVMIGLDACDLELVSQWGKEGHLPNLMKLKDTGATAFLDSSVQVLQGSIWPTFFTGTNPGEHGMYYMLQMDNGKQLTKRVRAHDLKHPPFWQALPSSTKKVVIDVPKLGLNERSPDLQVVEWAAMDHYSRFETQPRELKSDILATHGTHILTEDLVEPRSDEEYLSLHKRLLDGVAEKTKLNLSLLGKGEPGFFVSVYGESHTAGHYLWKHHQQAVRGELTLFAQDPLLDVYKQIDAGIGELIEAAGSDTNLFVFSGHGMMEDQYPRWILNEVLERMGVLKTFGKSTSDQHTTPADQQSSEPKTVSVSQRAKQAIKGFVNQHILPKSIQTQLWLRNLQKHVDFSATKAWVLPTDLQGFIRLNLQGREPQGIVRQDEYDQLVSEIEAGLLSLKDKNTGEPVVDKVFKIRELYSGAPHTDLLPDISVLWRNKQVDAVVSDQVGEIVVGSSGIERSGNHRPKGFCFAVGPDINTKNKEMSMNLEQLGPEAIALLTETQSRFYSREQSDAS